MYAEMEILYLGPVRTSRHGSPEGLTRWRRATSGGQRGGSDETGCRRRMNPWMAGAFGEGNLRLRHVWIGNATMWWNSTPVKLLEFGTFNNSNRSITREMESILRSDCWHFESSPQQSNADDGNIHAVDYGGAPHVYLRTLEKSQKVVDVSARLLWHN